MAEQILEVARQHAIPVTEGQAEQIQAYCELLWEWNQRLNLTRHTTYEQFVSRDLLDAYQLSQFLQPGDTVLDVGSGGGVPGILLAILRPDVSVWLSESTGKKGRALQAIVEQLGLHISVNIQRAEQIVAQRPFDVVVARAVGSLARILRWFRHDWHHIGRMLLVKGPRWVEERKEARHYGLLKPLQIRRLATYTMPETHSESVILGLYRRSTGAPPSEQDS